MSKRPPHGGKPPKPRTPKKHGPKKELLIIDDIDDALRRIWQRPKPRKK
jgi:hypothetical protein